MENKVYCEDCKWKEVGWGHLAKCNHKDSLRSVLASDYVKRKNVTYREFCSSINGNGDCPSFEKKKDSFLVRIKEFWMDGHGW